jgi:hypothetical protein
MENINLIKDIADNLEIIKKSLSSNNSKRWLNTSEAAIYLGYSKEHIPKLKNSHFIEGKHYYKKAGRVLFDRYELDNWVTTSQTKLNAKDIANDVLKDLT